MRIFFNPLIKLMAVFAAIGILAACGDNDLGFGNDPSYGYCILVEQQTCLDGPFTASTCNGQPSNSCPYQDVAIGSSSSITAGGGTSSSSSNNGGSSSSVGGTTTHSLDGVWESDHGIVISIYEGKAVFANIDRLAAWREVEKKGNIKIGDSKIRNIVKTGDLTWSCEELTYNLTTYELGSYVSTTITLNSNGQSFNSYSQGTSNQNVSYTRKSVSALDGVWESDHGIVISIYEGKAVFANIDRLAGWREVEKKGNIKIGDSKIRNIVKTGDLTWSCEELTYNPTTYELGSYVSTTITLNSNGQSFNSYSQDTSNQNVSYTRKQ